MSAEPSYLRLFRSGELAVRKREAYARLASCDLCPRRCGANRLKGEEGACRKGGAMQLAWVMSRRRGMEPFLVGTRGAGEVTFSGCPLHCVYCLIAPHSFFGRPISPAELAEIMLGFQKRGATSCAGPPSPRGHHNLHLVNATHFLPQILEALEIAVLNGFRLPLVYNTSGYEALDTLRLLEGIVDVYLPDTKYADPEAAERYSGVEDYPRVAREAIREMHRQVGDLVLDEEGVAARGLAVRHLVLPEGLAGTAEWMKFLADLSPKITVTLLSEYWPANVAYAHPPLHRRITKEEWEDAVRTAEKYGVDTNLSLRVHRVRRLEAELLALYYFHGEFCQKWGDENYARLGRWERVGKKGGDE